MKLERIINPYGSGKYSEPQKMEMICNQDGHPYFKKGVKYFISVWQNIHTGSILVHDASASIKAQNRSLTLHTEEKDFEEAWKEIKEAPKRSHMAKINKATPEDPKILKGQFEVVDGKLSFTCSTQNVSFDEVLCGLTLLRDELQRQIDNQQKCPFHPVNNGKV